LTEAQKKERYDNALEIWNGLKEDIKEELDRYQTFRIDKFEKFIRTDQRGKALLELYKPGTPEYAEFFDKEIGPYTLEIAKGKLGEGLQQVAGVLLVTGTVLAVIAFFGTDIVNFLTAPFTGFAQDFVRLYGF